MSAFDVQASPAPIYREISTLSEFHIKPEFKTNDSPGTIVVSATSSAYRAQILTPFFEASVELDRYSSFPKSWDGYSALPFSCDVVEAAKNIVNSFKSFFVLTDILPKKVSPGPCADGSIDIEVAVNERTLLISIAGDLQHITICRESERDGIAEEKTFLFEETDLEIHLYWLAGQMVVPLAMDSNRS